MLSGNSKYYDIIERTLYNGLISGISVDGINFFYPNPTESDGHNKFNMGSCTRQPWFDCSCCPTNLIRFIPSIPALIYATDKESMYINLFISSTAHVFVGGEKIEVTQKTDYPWDGKIKITINPEKEKIFRLRLRLPGWTQNNPVPGVLYSYLDRDHGEVNLSINGKKEEVNQNMGYAEILRRWKKDDSVELIFPLTVHRIIADNKVKDDSNKVAFEFGPVVYCAEEVDNEQISDIVIPDDMAANCEERTVMSETVISINGKVDEEEIVLIPYYLWSNRGVGKMKVWFPRNSN
jgi:hypothetical protein